MAKVTSLLRIHGSVGDATFFENEYGQQMKAKSGPTEWHVKNQKSYRNARRNAAEFKRASKGAQLLRVSMGSLLNGMKNMRLSGRMMAPMIQAIRRDVAHDWGERDVASGDLSVLTGFEFNSKLSLNDALPLNVENCYTIEDDKITLQLPAFRLRKKNALPTKATHYRLVSTVLTVNFAAGRYDHTVQTSPIFAMGRKAGEAFCAEHVLAAGALGCGWLLGIEFYTMKNDKLVLIRGGAMRVMHWVGSMQQAEEAVKEEATEQLVVTAPATPTVQAVPTATALPIVIPTPLPVVQVNYVSSGQRPGSFSYQVGQQGWYGTSST